MERTFGYSFSPLAADPVGSRIVSLDDAEIEAAAIIEVLQTPGAKVGTWSLLDALLEPVRPKGPFRFKGPIGQAREVKVAVSGLLGRFVARAYLTRYFGLSVYCHLGDRRISLNPTVHAYVDRTAPGDLPDWVACTAQLDKVTVAEAKGCHDVNGPAQALKRAWNQVQRVDVRIETKIMPVKRIAVATRWGFHAGGPRQPLLWVQDPDDAGDDIDPKRRDQAYLGILRRHLATLLEPLGQADFARSLTALAELGESAPRAISDLASLPGVRIEGVESDDLIGGMITRAGPVPGDVDTGEDLEVLRRLDLMPRFVGVERETVRAALTGDVAELRQRSNVQRQRQGDVVANADGTWVVPLSAGRSIVRTTSGSS